MCGWSNHFWGRPYDPYPMLWCGGEVISSIYMWHKYYMWRCTQSWPNWSLSFFKAFWRFQGWWWWWTDTSLRYSTATEECVSNDFFRHLLDDSPASYFDIAAQPILEYRWIDSYTQQSLRTQFKVATVSSIHTQSLSWCSTGLVPNVLPRRNEGSGKPCAVDRAS